MNFKHKKWGPPFKKYFNIRFQSTTKYLHIYYKNINNSQYLYRTVLLTVNVNCLPSLLVVHTYFEITSREKNKYLLYINFTGSGATWNNQKLDKVSDLKANLLCSMSTHHLLCHAKFQGQGTFPFDQWRIWPLSPKSTQNISLVDDEVLLHQTLTIGTHQDSMQPSVDLSR